MIDIVSVEIRGKSERSDFIGRLEFSPGLQVISGPNSFGKIACGEVDSLVPGPRSDLRAQGRRSDVPPIGCS